MLSLRSVSVCRQPLAVGRDPPPLCDADRNLVLSVITSANCGSALSRVDTREGIRAMEINNAAIYTDVVLTTWNTDSLQ